MTDYLAAILIILLALFIWLYYDSLRKARKISSDKQSLSVKYGKMTEQFFPFMNSYRHNPQNFRFLGTPVDGIQFEDDKIIFVEFKSGSSNLSEKQKKIRELVDKKKVEFEEVRIN